MTTLDQRHDGVVASTLAAATGRHQRTDRVLPRTGGPAGNAVLTAWTGLVLLVLSVAQLLTLFDVSGLITWHVAIGALLVPPALVKTGTTTWRMLRYYRGQEAYVEAGPPPIVFRLLGPLVVLSTLGLLATGGLLVLLGEPTIGDTVVSLPFLRVSWVTVHQAAFFVWATATGIHLLGRLVPALRATVLRARGSVAVPGRGRRAALAAVTLAVAVLLAVLLTHEVSVWNDPGVALGAVGPSALVHR